MNSTLYPWQEDCLASWFSHHGQGIVQAVTGSGKTLMALEAAHRLKQKLCQEQNRMLNVKIVVPTGALMRQWEKELRQFLISLPEKQQHSSPNHAALIGLRGGGFKDQAERPYMIYVVNSARYELARQILHELRNGKAVLLIADECHHYVSSQNQLIFEFLPHIQPYRALFFSLGLSATLPSGDDGRMLSSVLGPRIYSYGMEKARSLQTVCPYDIFSVELPFTGEEWSEYHALTDKMSRQYSRLLPFCPLLRSANQKERFELLRELAAGKNLQAADMAASYMMLSYQRKRLLCLASSRIPCAAALIRRLDPKEKIIIFSERIQQADELFWQLQKQYPERIGRYHSQMGTLANKHSLERFRTGELRILISCKAMDEGVDIPDASVGIILSGTSTQRQRIQRLGRIIRKKEGKTRALLYYFYIADTSESNGYLPDSRDIRAFDLEYRPDSEDFFCPDYHNRAVRLTAQLKHAGTSEEKLREIQRCLRLGSVRADWKLPPAELEHQRNTAVKTREKNYWNCMKKLQEINEIK